MFVSAYRILKSLNRSSTGKLIALGVWILICISIYDRVHPRINKLFSISKDVGLVAQDLFLQDAMQPALIRRQFDPSKPKSVLVLGYQRCGSTFTGNIFNQNPDAFYLFEPADGIYGTMYGARPGYSVPSDIANYWNGSERIMPYGEIKSVADVLSALLSCDFENVPTEVLLHRFMYLFKHQQRRLSFYTECLRSHNLNIPNCLRYISEICPSRFGEDTLKEEYCRNMLWDKHSNIISVTDPINKHQSAFNSYKQCMQKQRATLLQKCLPDVLDVCKSSNVRATKTVRVTMESANLMFEQMSNFRVLHLIRDPRAVVLSRMGDPTYRGKFSGQSLVKEASLYCRGVLKDVIVRSKIEQRFPGSVLQVMYEHLVSNPIGQVKTIYSFLNEEMPSKVEEWLLENTDGHIKNSTKIAEKWQEKITFKVAREINSVCADMFEAINYDWIQAS